MTDHHSEYGRLLNLDSIDEGDSYIYMEPPLCCYLYLTPPGKQDVTPTHSHRVPFDSVAQTHHLFIDSSAHLQEHVDAALGEDNLHRIRQAYDLVQSAFQIPQNFMVLAGGAIRDVYFGHEPNDWDFFILGQQLGVGVDMTGMLKHLLAMSYPYSPPTVEMDPVELMTRYGHLGRMQCWPLGHIMFAGMKVNLILANATTVGDLLDTFDYKVNRVAYDGDEFYGVHNLVRANKSGLMRLGHNFWSHKLTREGHKRILERGVRIGDRLNLRLDPYEVKKQAESSQVPVLKTVTERLIGYRGYSVRRSDNRLTIHGDYRDAYLVGGYSKIWYGPTMHAECGGSTENCVEHLIDQSCMCGINCYKGMPENDYLRQGVVASCTLWGTVWELEHGYRAEYAEINHLWILKSTPKGLERFANIEDLKERLESVYKVPVEIVTYEKLAGIIKANRRLDASPPRKFHRF